MRAAGSTTLRTCLAPRLKATLSGEPSSLLRRLRDRPACRRIVSSIPITNMAPIKDKWVCIVGASRGIGLEVRARVRATAADGVRCRWQRSHRIGIGVVAWLPIFIDKRV